MIGLVLATQDQLAKALLAALNDALGEQKHIGSVTLAGSDTETQRRHLLNAIRSADAGEGVLLCVDDMNSVAGQLTPSLFPHVTIEVISGVNMPMLKKVALHREGLSLKNLAELARDEGRNAINWQSAS